MPFIAECLHCRGSRFQVPNKKRGTFEHCPKCDREFLLVPQSSVDSQLVAYNFDPTEDDDPDEPTAAVPLPELQPTTVAVAELQPEPVVAPPIVVESQPAHIEPSSIEPATVGALVALGLFGFSILVSQFPYGRFVAGPIAVLGVIIAAFAWLALERRQWLGALALALNLLAVLLVTALPSWLGLSTWTPSEDPEAAPKPVTAVGRDGSLPQVADSVDASKAVWQQGDVRIAVTHATIGAWDPEAKTAEKRKERALRIGLKVANVGVARTIDFTGWKLVPPDEPKLAQAGKVLSVRASSHTGTSIIFPGKSAECDLTFVVPTGKDDLQLELAPSAFSGTDTVRFSIPRAFVSGR